MKSTGTGWSFRPKLSNLVFILLVFMVIALIYVWFNIKITRLNYEIASEMSRRDALMEENGRLKLEKATLKSSERIEKIARTKINMTYPEKDQLVFIR